MTETSYPNPEHGTTSPGVQALVDQNPASAGVANCYASPAVVPSAEAGQSEGDESFRPIISTQRSDSRPSLVRIPLSSCSSGTQACDGEDIPDAEAEFNRYSSDGSMTMDENEGENEDNDLAVRSYLLDSQLLAQPQPTRIVRALYDENSAAAMSGSTYPGFSQTQAPTNEHFDHLFGGETERLADAQLAALNQSNVGREFLNRNLPALSRPLTVNDPGAPSSEQPAGFVGCQPLHNEGPAPPKYRLVGNPDYMTNIAQPGLQGFDYGHVRQPSISDLLPCAKHLTCPVLPTTLAPLYQPASTGIDFSHLTGPISPEYTGPAFSEYREMSGIRPSSSESDDSATYLRRYHERDIRPSSSESDDSAAYLHGYHERDIRPSFSESGGSAAYPHRYHERALDILDKREKRSQKRRNRSSKESSRESAHSKRQAAADRDLREARQRLRELDQRIAERDRRIPKLKQETERLLRRLQSENQQLQALTQPQPPQGYQLQLEAQEEEKKEEAAEQQQHDKKLTDLQLDGHSDYPAVPQTYTHNNHQDRPIVDHISTRTGLQSPIFRREILSPTARAGYPMAEDQQRAASASSSSSTTSDLADGVAGSEESHEDIFQPAMFIPDLRSPTARARYPMEADQQRMAADGPRAGGESYSQQYWNGDFHTRPLIQRETHHPHPHCRWM
ncbi:uncharacterized protein BO97DRAFT_271156 [Aspergillus homomorphus CBS 101889]|uniref:BZIP domain-containing protein n=1 Tax=Aspergillus homomorphus (strain CBS 101889) TaxID=1450537 RepID=A0A395I5L9_ASPHC|nr:hypothetical protein BO97DRAFT_271156 [Aspergillus homomorphus CBS 101889]RAL14488.1 hypothetical protein BO97DRAFT_271156 [Aspergillus homomorphus CBS 101889]